MPKRLPLLEEHALYGLSFNGANGYVSIPNSASLQITGDLSIACWLKITSLSKQALIYKFWGGEFALYLQSNGAVTFALGTNPQQEPTVLSAGSVSAGLWHLIAITRDATNKILKGYLNAVLGLSPSYAATVATSTNPVLIGSEDHLWNWLNGTISEIQIYNRVLSQAEIQRNMYNPLNPVHSGLVLFLPMIEGAGTAVNDYSGLGNNGVTSGGVSWYEMALHEPQADVL